MVDRHLTDLDLVAYADGRLERDPARRKRVEQWLENDPAAREKAEAYLVQSRLLRDAYPLPDDDVAEEWVERAVAKRARPRYRQLTRVAAGVALAVACGFAGWTLGRGDASSNPHLEAFLDGELLGSPEASASSGPVAPGSAPTLDAAGFRLVDQQEITKNGQRVMRFIYENEEGAVAQIFQQPRPQPLPPQVAVAQRDGTSLAVWEDDAYSYGLVIQGSVDTVRKLAGVARQKPAVAAAGQQTDHLALEPLPAGPGRMGPGATAPTADALSGG